MEVSFVPPLYNSSSPYIHPLYPVFSSNLFFLCLNSSCFHFLFLYLSLPSLTFISYFLYFLSFSLPLLCFVSPLFLFLFQRHLLLVLMSMQCHAFTPIPCQRSQKKASQKSNVTPSIAPTPNQVQTMVNEKGMQRERELK